MDTSESSQGVRRFADRREFMIPKYPDPVVAVKGSQARSLMAGELLFAGLGLGQMLNMGRDLDDMSLVLSVMLVITAVGLAVDRLVFGGIESWVQERWGLATSWSRDSTNHFRAKRMFRCLGMHQ